jgi:lipoprotein signal peptidase
MFTTRFETWVRRRAEALMSAIGRIPITPNQITVIGVALTFVAAVLVAIGLAIYVARNSGDLRADAVLGLIMGGTLGNGYERIVNGTVTDFINVHFWPVFNVADSAISIGVVALLAGYVLRKPDTA